MYSSAQIPTNGGESGRDRLRRINNSRGEAQRQVDRQERPVVDRPIYRSERQPAPVPIAQAQNLGRAGNSAFPGGTTTAQIPTNNIGGGRGPMPNHIGKPRANPNLVNFGAPIHRGNQIPRMPPSITPVTSVPSREQAIRVTTAQGHPIPGLPGGTAGLPVVSTTNVPISPGPGANGPPSAQLVTSVTGVSPTQNKMEPDNRRLQIQATLRTLNENVPFRVRFKREPSVRGRVYGFECSTQRPSTELKVFIEYPIGSGKSYMSASAAAKQMSLEASSGNMEKMTPISSGFKFLEYEHKHRSDDWRLLGDFLTEDVRYFKASPHADWIPSGYNDPNVAPPPKITPDSPSDEDIIVTDVRPGGAQKRTTPPEGGRGSAEPNAKRPAWMDQAKEEMRSRSPKNNTPDGTVPREGTPNPDITGSPGADSQTANGQPSLLCFICKQRLEASHFVQCPSQQIHRYNTHRFCFPCCQKTIRHALSENPNQEVFCPSGLRCAISGSQNPWAFMQAEIETILDRATVSSSIGSQPPGIGRPTNG